jgi:hypothetical protein
MIRFRCPKCRESLKAPPLWAGALTECPGCGHQSRVPAPLPAPARPVPLTKVLVGEPEGSDGVLPLAAAR